MPEAILKLLPPGCALVTWTVPPVVEFLNTVTCTFLISRRPLAITISQEPPQSFARPIVSRELPAEILWSIVCPFRGTLAVEGNAKGIILLLKEWGGGRLAPNPVS